MIIPVLFSVYILQNIWVNLSDNFIKYQMVTKQIKFEEVKNRRQKINKLGYWTMMVFLLVFVMCRLLT